MRVETETTKRFREELDASGVTYTIDGVWLRIVDEIENMDMTGEDISFTINGEMFVLPDELQLKVDVVKHLSL